MPGSRIPPSVLAAQAAERGFVRLFGGYSLGLAGGTLLVNERIGVPRFNLVQIVRVALERQTAFFEAALDHYFQRGLRPSFRLAIPVPEHLDEALRELAFRPGRTEELWLIAGPERPHRPATGVALEPVPASELDRLVELWIGPTGGAEFRRHLEVGRQHPNPDEQLEPYWLRAPDGALRSAGLAYRRGETLDLEGISTPTARRGAGAATDWVTGVLGTPIARGASHVAFRTTLDRVADHLAPWGFELALRSVTYELPPDAALALRGPPATGGPRWRPPRIA